MTYTGTDPRSTLPSTDPPRPDSCADPQFFEFNRLRPDEVTAIGSRSWYVRGQNFTLGYTMAKAGESLHRHDQPDEYMIVLPDGGASAVVHGAGQSTVIDGAAVVVVPPGNSSIDIAADTVVVRLLSSCSPDLLAASRNTDAYAQPDPNVAPFTPWPAAPGGAHVRVYRINDYPYAAGRFGRIFRCSTFMVNFFDPDLGPRDPGALSPHSHPDFEQISLVTDGEYAHHIRVPWGVDRAHWREDTHHRCGSPSLAVIPPPTEHTSQSLGQVRNHLIDIFCPPRTDFSLREGWVLNAADYPMPDIDDDDHS
ncbi:hypothetical protein MPY17_39595 (plasmid) [Rhodococcus opacus]|uniref:hypothetical protein n=1 Tax=Rhodococcus opacus TaxID=37919 RepID=UPI001FF12151|nr:hypothetical protein [Rhodococcus opacus]UOT08503.1 hypothetical protein MPY17_39595 [Rhodococcus opacus]